MSGQAGCEVSQAGTAEVTVSLATVVVAVGAVVAAGMAPVYVVLGLILARIG